MTYVTLAVCALPHLINAWPFISFCALFCGGLLGAATRARPKD